MPISATSARSAIVSPARATLRSGRCRSPSSDFTEQLPHDAEELPGVVRLRQVRVRAGSVAVQLGLRQAQGREHQDAHLPRAVEGAQALAHGIAVHVRQHEIQDHEVGAPRARLGQRFAAPRLDLHVVAARLEAGLQEARDVPLVLDDEDALPVQLVCGVHVQHAYEACPVRVSRRRARAADMERSWRGDELPSISYSLTQTRGKRRVATRPGASSERSRRAPCSLATAATRLSPRPVPGFPRAGSRRTKRCSTCSRSEAGIPGPWSATEISGPPGPSRTATEIVPAGGENLIALSTRLLSACESRWRFPRTWSDPVRSARIEAPASSATGP